MVSYAAYAGILLGINCGVFIIYMLIFIFLIPLWNYAKCLKIFFNIKVEVNDNDDEKSQKHILTSDGKKIDITKSKICRIYPAVIVSFLLTATTMTFITGCVIAVQYYRSGDLCPNHPRDCFMISKSVTAVSPIDPFVCNPGETIKQSNLTSSRLVICYGFVLKEQTLLNVVKRIGISTVVLVILSVVFTVLYRFAHLKYGIIINIILMLGISTATILLVVYSVRLDFVLHYLLGITLAICCWTFAAKSYATLIHYQTHSSTMVEL